MLLTIGNKGIFLMLMFDTAENTYFVIIFAWKKQKNVDFHGAGRHSTTAKNVLDMKQYTRKKDTSSKRMHIRGRSYTNALVATLLANLSQPKLAGTMCTT